MEKFKCICEKEFDNFEKLKTHQYNCKYCNKIKIQFYINNKDKILKLYKDHSLLYISNYLSENYHKLGFIGKPYSVILCNLKKDGIHIKTLKESNNLQSVKDKRSNFFMENYGVRNASQVNYVKEKKRQKAQEVYGCDNVFQAEEIKEKSKNTMLEKYGTLHIDNKNNGRESKLHFKVLNYLKSLGYECISEYTVKCKNKDGKIIRTPRADIYIPKLNLCIEVYGDWCHANPRKFEKEDLIELWECKKYNRTLYAIEVWVKDEIRLNQIKHEGYNVSVIWEQDIKENNFNSLLQDLEYLESKLKENDLPNGYGWKTINCIYEGNKLCYGFDKNLNFIAIA